MPPNISPQRHVSQECFRRSVVTQRQRGGPSQSQRSRTQRARQRAVGMPGAYPSHLEACHADYNDRLSKPYGVRAESWFRLTACHPNRAQARELTTSASRRYETVFIQKEAPKNSGSLPTRAPNIACICALYSRDIAWVENATENLGLLASNACRIYCSV
jgi:hypothetical protein